jgi:hypothetical protein
VVTAAGQEAAAAAADFAERFPGHDRDVARLREAVEGELAERRIRAEAQRARAEAQRAERPAPSRISITIRPRPSRGAGEEGAPPQTRPAAPAPPASPFGGAAAAAQPAGSSGGAGAEGGGLAMNGDAASDAAAVSTAEGRMRADVRAQQQQQQQRESAGAESSRSQEEEVPGPPPGDPPGWAGPHHAEEARVGPIIGEEGEDGSYRDAGQEAERSSQVACCSNLLC